MKNVIKSSNDSLPIIYYHVTTTSYIYIKNTQDIILYSMSGGPSESYLTLYRIRTKSDGNWNSANVTTWHSDTVADLQQKPIVSASKL